MGAGYVSIMFLIMPFLAFVKIGTWRWVPRDILFGGLKFFIFLAFLWGTGNWLLGKFIKMPKIKRKEIDKNT